MFDTFLFEWAKYQVSRVSTSSKSLLSDLVETRRKLFENILNWIDCGTGFPQYKFHNIKSIDWTLHVYSMGYWETDARRLILSFDRNSTFKSINRQQKPIYQYCLLRMHIYVLSAVSVCMSRSRGTVWRYCVFIVNDQTTASINYRLNFFSDCNLSPILQHLNVPI